MKKNKLSLFSVFVLLVFGAAVVGFRGAGRWLTSEDPLSKADVIFVLSGGLPYRAEEAAKVFGMGYASEVWLSLPVSPSDKLEKLGIHFAGEEEYSTKILLHEGVPEGVIHILPEPIVDTEQEVAEAAERMRQTGKTKVIIVTSPLHTRRVRALWTRLAGNGLHLLVHAAHEDPSDIDHWWRNTHDASSVVHETVGLLNVWAGLPVRPRSLRNHS
jgi:uncharacterized SAM-binding protein YcdF (DUF218 family)